jgi:3-deoxy-manno-octulosonate cytidylyltransferase (CMP-KDO synthetase)
MICRVHGQAAKSKLLDRLVIATDDERIFQHASSFGAEAVMTRDTCRNGTERTEEALQRIGNGYDIVINIQGDEPLLQPTQLDLLIQLLRGSDCDIATLAHKLESGETSNEHIVKVAFGHEMDDAFGRAGIAHGFSRDYDFIANAEETVYKHIGLYAFRTPCLEKVTALQPTPNELLERLEQLRWVDHGYKIAVGLTSLPNYSVDVPEDIHKIIDVLKVSAQN